MRHLPTFAIALLAACGGSTGPSPKGLDPSVLLVNQSADWARIIFASDQSGALIYDTISVAPSTTVCARWTQTFDSLYVKVVDTLPNTSGLYATQVTPWLHFAQYPYYFQVDTLQVVISGPDAGSRILNHIAG